VYNWGKELRSWAYEASKAYGAEKKGLTQDETLAILARHKKKKPWLKEVSSQALQQSIRDLGDAYKNFFAGRAKYPRFKRKHSRQSARFPRNSFSLKKSPYGRKLYLANMPGDHHIKVNWHQPMDEKPSTCTVVQKSDGRYYVSFVTERRISPLPKTKATVGIDLGLTDVIVTSDGWKSGNPRFLEKAQKRLRREQKKLSRKRVKGTNNWRRQKRRVAKAHAKVKDARKTWIHKLTKRLVEEYDVICTESLAVKNMLRNHCLARGISDVAWGELVRQLEYKADWYGKEVVKVDRFYPSSKTCSCCGHKRAEMPLDVRHWTCEDCGAEHDRDINAAKNIRRAGLARTGGFQPQKAP
jgi:putative transposase